MRYADVVYAVWYKKKGRDRVKKGNSKTPEITLEELVRGLRFFWLPHKGQRMRKDDIGVALDLEDFAKEPYFAHKGVIVDSSESKYIQAVQRANYEGLML